MRHWQLSLLVPLLACGASCFSLTPSSDGTGASGTGARSSSGGSSSTYVPPKCEQGCQDYLVAWALDATLWFIWNQKVAGHPAGAQDITGTCPLGGTVHITGSDSVTADGTTTTDIQFELDGCQNSKEVFDLTFTGTVRMEGSFNGDAGTAAEVFTATGLKAAGTLHYIDDPPIDDSCDLTMAQDGSGDGSSLAGKLCGRTFDESALGSQSQGGTGGSSSGGSSSSSGSGNSCACFCPDGSDCTAAKTPNPCGLDADGIPEACGCPVGCK